jgi:hypothetical protein
VLWYIKGGGKLKYHKIGNFYLQTIMVLLDGGAASGFDSMPPEK